MGKAKNNKIKKAGTVTEHTPETLAEFVRCARDPIYFCKNYVKVQHPTKGAIPLELYDYQEEMIQNYMNDTYNIVLSARQTGKCSVGSTPLNTLTKPSYLKKLILRLVNRGLYDVLFK